jgi:hypothetical protein
MARKIIRFNNSVTGREEYFEIGDWPWRIRRLMCRLFGHYPGPELESVIGWQGNYTKYVSCARCRQTAAIATNLPGKDHQTIRISDAGYTSGWTDAKLGHANKTLEAGRLKW